MCRGAGRRARRREAARRYQQSYAGRRDHAARQARYRAKQKVTHLGSEAVAASSSVGMSASLSAAIPVPHMPSALGVPDAQTPLYVKPTRETTRLYLTLGGRELLRAVLPPPNLSLHPRSAPTLLEGLALWLQRPLSVVLYAGDEDYSFALGLSDGFGFGRSSEHYDVEVVN